MKLIWPESNVNIAHIYHTFILIDILICNITDRNPTVIDPNSGTSKMDRLICLLSINYLFWILKQTSSFLLLLLLLFNTALWLLQPNTMRFSFQNQIELNTNQSIKKICPSTWIYTKILNVVQRKTVGTIIIELTCLKPNTNEITKHTKIQIKWTQWEMVLQKKKMKSKNHFR